MIRLKIKKHDDKHIQLEAIEGIEHFGFGAGTSLCDLEPEEIECDKFSKDVLLSVSEKSGLCGLMIWKNNRLAWGTSSETVIIHIDEISSAVSADGWLSHIAAT